MRSSAAASLRSKSRTALMAGEQATGVKVVKETYNEETGDYLTLKIFEDGHNQMKEEPAPEDAPQRASLFQA